MRQLRGVKHEPGSTLYLDDIEVYDNENDDYIIHLIKCHAKSITYIIALIPGFWDNQVKCRRWAKEPPRGRNQMQAYRYSGTNSHSNSNERYDNNGWGRSSYWDS